MIRNLKVLGLALAAVFAMSAVVASGASAQTVGKLTVSGGSSATLDMTEIPGKTNALTAFGEPPVECVGSVLTGHKYNVTPHVPVPAGDSKVTITPHYTNCHTSPVGGQPTHKVTVTMNGCDFDATVLETFNNEANTYKVTFDITCPVNKDIEVEVYAFAGSELGGVQCKITVKEQLHLTGPHLVTDTANDDLRVEGTVTGIHVEKSGSGCATATTNTGEQHINVTIEGTDAVKNPTGITITH